jgi:hypothetical protein
MRIKQPPDHVNLPMVVVGSTSSSSFLAVIFSLVTLLPKLRIDADLTLDKADLKDEREVGSSEGEKLAALWGCTYHETSAVSLHYVVHLHVPFSCRPFNIASLSHLNDQDLC